MSSAKDSQMDDQLKKEAEKFFEFAKQQGMELPEGSKQLVMEILMKELSQKQSNKDNND